MGIIVNRTRAALLESILLWTSLIATLAALVSTLLLTRHIATLAALESTFALLIATLAVLVSTLLLTGLPTAFTVPIGTRRRSARCSVGIGTISSRTAYTWPKWASACIVLSVVLTFVRAITIPVTTLIAVGKFLLPAFVFHTHKLNDVCF